MSDTPRVDREVYTATERDVGFEVVNPALARQLERELAAAKADKMRWVDEATKEHDVFAALSRELKHHQKILDEIKKGLT